MQPSKQKFCFNISKWRQSEATPISEKLQSFFKYFHYVNCQSSNLLIWRAPTSLLSHYRSRVVFSVKTLGIILCNFHSSYIVIKLLWLWDGTWCKVTIKSLLQVGAIDRISIVLLTTSKPKALANLRIRWEN